MILSSLLVLGMLGLGARMIWANPTITVQLSTAQIFERDPAPGPGDEVVNFNITLSAPVPAGNLVVIDAVVVPLDPANPEYAAPGVDYSAVPMRLTFTPGESAKQFPVTIIADDLDELNEGFFVRTQVVFPDTTLPDTTPVSNDTYAIIFDDDNQAVTGISNPIAAENAGTIDFVVSLDAASTVDDIRIAYRTVAVTATDGSDYTGTSTGMLIIPKGSSGTTFTISIPLVDDAIDEMPETFTLELLPADSANVNFGPTSATGTITDDNDAPSASNQTLSFDEETAALQTASITGVTDPDSVNFTYSTSDTITPFVLASDGTVFLATALNYEAPFTPIIFEVTITDDGTPARSTTIEVTLALNDVNEAPVVDADSPAPGIDGTATFGPIGSGPISIAPNLSLTDPDAGDQITTVTVTIAGVQATEVLAVTVGTSGVTDSYNTVTGVLTLTGPVSPADMQAVLRTLTYNYTALTLGTTSRSVTIVANDGALDSSTATITIDVEDNAPTIDTNATLTVDEGGSGLITTTYLDASDSDTPDANLTFTVVADPSNGSLERWDGAAWQSFVTFTQDDLANNRIRYTHDGSETLSDSFTFTLSDGTTTLPVETFNISVTAQNDAPTAAPSQSGSVAEDAAPTTLVMTVTASDPDGPGLTYTSSDTPSVFNLASNGDITVASALNYEGTPSYTFTVNVSDGVAPAVPVTVTISVTDVNERPVVDANGAGDGIDDIVAYTERAPAANIAPNLVLTDPEQAASTSPNNGRISQVVVDITNLLDGTNEQLDATVTGTSVTINKVYDSGNGTLTLTPASPMTVAEMQSVLRTLTYLNASNTPSASRLVTVTATDAGTPGLSNNPLAQITINIEPVDNPPTVTTNTGMTVLEGASGTITTARLSASDPDTANANLVFNVTGGPSNGSLSSTTFTQADLVAGTVTYTHSGGENTSDSFTFTLSDGTTTLPEATFTITVTPQNDAPTASSPQFGSVAEDAPPTTPVMAVTATDPDSTLTYDDTNVPAVFSLDTSTGVITVAGALDRETTPSYTFTVDVSDGVAPAVPVAVTINITDVNERPVVDANGSGDGIDNTITYTEQYPPTPIAPNLELTDPDSLLPNSYITHVVVQITNPQPDDQLVVPYTPSDFIYTPGSGSVTITTYDPFYSLSELRDVLRSVSYFNPSNDPSTPRTVTITAIDYLGLDNIPPATITITIEPEDDAPIVANNGAGVDEGASGVITTTNLSATDPDTADAGLTFTVQSGPFNGQLEYWNGSAWVVVTGFTQDDLANNRIRYTHDGGETTSDSFTFTLSDSTTTLPAATFNITVNPLNDAPTAASPQSFSIAENTSGPVGEVLVSDVDGPALAYISGDARFTLTPTPGGATLSLTSGLDYEALLPNNTIIFDVDVSDGAGGTTTVQVEVTITDVNEAPVVDANGAPAGINASVTYTERAPATPIASALTLTDPENNAISLVVLQITAPIDGTNETLDVTVAGTPVIKSYNPTLGTLTLTGPATLAEMQTVLRSLTYTNASSIPLPLRVVTITATDAGAPPASNNSAVPQVSITIIPIDDVPTLTNNGMTVLEGGSGPITTAQLSASDPDTANADLVFDVTGGPINGLLSATTFTQADLVAGTVTYTHNGSETTSDSFTFTLRDGTTTLPEATFTITVTPQNDAPTASSPQSGSVAEDATVGTPVMSVTATDPDSPLTYDDTNVPAVFILNTSTGAITVNGALDRETTPSYTFTVNVSDGVALPVPVTVTIDVTNVNERPVVDANGNGPGDGINNAVAYTEQDPATLIAPNLDLTDPDAGDTIPAVVVQIDSVQPGETLAVNVGSSGVSAFSGTGTLTLIGPATPAVMQDVLRTLTYANTSNTPNTPRTVRIAASDAGGLDNIPLATITITITPVDDVPVVGNASMTVSEGSTNPVTLSASDPDTAAANLTFTVTGGPSNGSLSATTFTQAQLSAGTVTYTHDGTNTSSDSFTFTLSDGVNTPVPGTFNITITAQNDAPIAAPQTFDVPENTAVGFSWPIVVAPDPDGPNALAFSVAAYPLSPSPFVVDSAGNISVALPLDYETFGPNPYVFNVAISDGLDTTTIAITINVTNANDPPYVTGPVPLAFTVAENYTGLVGTITAADSDLDPIQFSVQGVSPFSVDASGNVTLNTAFDADTITSTSFTIRIWDGQVGHEVDLVVPVTITNVNEPPVADANGGAAGINGTFTYNERTGAQQIASGLVLTDPENDTIDRAYVQFVAPYTQLAGESLGASTVGSIVPSYDPSTGILTIPGPATLADMQTVLRSLTYDNTSYTPPAARTLHIIAWDTGSPSLENSPYAQIQINITPLADAPTVTPQTFTVSEGATKAFVGELSATDPDTLPANLTYTVTSGPTNGTLSSTTFTQAQLDAGSVTYTHDGTNTTSDSFTFTLSDGINSVPGTLSIVITGENDAPVVTTSAGTTSYNLPDPAVVIDAAATLTDGDSSDLNGGQLQVSLDAATSTSGDILGVNSQPAGPTAITVAGTNISYGGVVIGTMSGGSYPNPLVITFNSAAATPAAVQALMQNITFANATTTTSLVRTVTFIVDDGDGGASAAQTKGMVLNNTPVAVDDTGDLVVDSGNVVISVLDNDSDLDNDTFDVTAVTQGTHGSVIFDATTVTYTPTAGYMGSDTFTYTITDSNGASATATVTIEVNPHRVYLPLVVRSAFAELVVDFTVNPTSPKVRGPAAIEVTVTNNGEISATNFWVDFYIQPSRAPQVNEPWYELCSMNPCLGLAWYYTGTLAPGQSVVLNSNPQSAANPNGFTLTATNWQGFFNLGTQKLYAYVDSWNRSANGTVRDPNGAVIESNEANNRAEKTIVLTPNAQAAPLQEVPANRNYTRP
ncbi:cadherin-like domain-containing protein [Candidatus Oscillochloris fontis]|uniref:cadherin-like domain-containing protein n=1 Tax=Candidatus Oscillochloris fontis TaxID=2496868 RepID=UPI0013760FDA|nr:cadherin-like domain-containing protein [Candidatus Oscillochloris fontis]